MNLDEQGNTYIQRNLKDAQDLQSAGLEIEKSWSACSDGCDICKRNEAASWIPLDRPFPSGHQTPLAHDGCRCDLMTRMKPDQQDEQESKLSESPSQSQSIASSKKLPVLLIVIGSIIGLCCLCIGIMVALDSMGLLPAPTSSPISTSLPAQPNKATPIIGRTLDEYMQEYGGNRDVYIRILTLQDCAALQEEFNQASENNARETPGTKQFKWTLGYMQAANDQMSYLSCYK